MNILSLFDGMSCAQIALKESGIKYNNYFASEIDKHAIKVTQHNFPDTIQLGSVVDVDCSKLPKIDILFGGSPCQSFSFAGKRKGMSTKDSQEILTLEHYLELKSEGYEFEGQSYLFWEYMRILSELRKVNPDIKFFLENVEMGEKWERVLSKAIGVNGIHVNSALVSAQNRKRIYWLNFGMLPGGLFGEMQSIIKQPKDRGILLKDILESEVDEKYYLSEKVANKLFQGTDINGKNNTLRSSGHQSQTKKHNFDLIKIDKKGNIKDNQEKASCFTAGGHSGGNHSDMDLIVHNTMPRSSTTGKGGTGPLSRNDGKTYCLDTGSTNAIEIREVKQLNPSTESGGKQPYQQNRVYDKEGISPALCANKSDLLVLGCDYRSDEGLRIRDNGKSGTLAARARNDESCGQLASINHVIRRLTPTECKRLQTVPDWYDMTVLSDTQQYKVLGNGWTIEVIKHFLSYL
jgi:DNA (cytosine-5)-methyltransferase 3A